MAVEQRFAVIVDADGEAGILVSIALAVAWHWTACHPLAVGSSRVAELLGYLFCLHLYAAIF